MVPWDGQYFSHSTIGQWLPEVSPQLVCKANELVTYLGKGKSYFDSWISSVLEKKG